MDFEDHGDPSIDERWRRMLDPMQRHASQAGFPLARFQTADDPHFAPEDFVPPEFHAEGRSSLAICQAIPNGPGSV